MFKEIWPLQDLFAVFWLVVLVDEVPFVDGLGEQLEAALSLRGRLCIPMLFSDALVF